MVRRFINKKNLFLEGKLEESKILFAYRYISLFITSTFYLLNHPDHEFIRKIIIISCLGVSAIILSYLYLIYEDSPRLLVTLLVIETIGNTMLLVPSGGIKSPFIWYSLNTILVSSIFLGKRYCWINFLLYLLGYGIIIGLTNNTNMDMIQIIRDESNLLLSFIMIIACVQTWTIFIKKTKEESKRLQEANIQLETANKLISDSTDHIKELYQSVNILANQGNRDGIIRIAFEHIKKITKTNMVFYYDIRNNTNKVLSSGDKELLKSIEEHILVRMLDISRSKEPLEINILESKLLVVPVTSTYGVYGILGLEIPNKKESVLYRENINQLQFLSELISTAFDSLTLEEVNERLLITEEQNRIANEIHDSVLQRLFGMSCSMFSLIKRLNTYSNDEIKDEVNLFRETTDSTMKELRDKIYGLSWKKSGRSSFSKDIKKYIDEASRLNQVNIPFSVLGDLETLSTNQKKALYRMICEGIANAIRHGKASNIEVTLNISEGKINLYILDDGIGFNIEQVKKDTSRGLGMDNFYQLTEDLQGEIDIESSLNKGTKIKVILPIELLKGEVAI